MKIRTNNVPRPIVSGCHLDGKHGKQARADYGFLGDEFDSALFVTYRDHVHYLGNFVFSPSIDGWDGIDSDSPFRGTVIRVHADENMAVMGYVIQGPES